jgi:hypothetical protein
MNMGKRIQQRLNELHWSRKDLLCRVPDLTAQALSNLIVRDSKRSEWDEIIAEALGVTVLWLVYGKGQHVVSEPSCMSYEFLPKSDDENLIVQAFRRGDQDDKTVLKYIAKAILRSQ